MKTSHIHIKIDENLKERVQAKAKAESTTLTAVLTGFLVHWVKEGVEVMQFYNWVDDEAKLYTNGFEIRDGVPICPYCSGDYHKCPHEVKMTANPQTLNQ